MLTWLKLLALTLMAYACLGRGFAHLGIPPLYVGDVVLLAGLLTAFCVRGVGVAARLPTVWMWAAFACWGAMRTIPFLGSYGFDALRDAVTWAYGIFAVLVAAFLLKTGNTELVLQRYPQWVRWFLIIVPVPLVLTFLLGVFIPTPFSDSVSLIQVRCGDTAVHLAGALAFVMTGLASRGSTGTRRFPLMTLLAALGFMIAAVVVVCASRAALLVLITATVIVLILRPSARIVRGSIPVIGIVGVFVIVNPTLTMTEGRQVSPQQILKNLSTSFSGEPSDRNLDDSREWRLDWWNTIIQYTIHGDYFWQGKGFGIDLAQDDEFTVSDEDETRSPHNAFLCILARSGVLGLGLWVALQVVFAGALLRAYLIARRARASWWIAVNVWLLAYWAAFTVNAALDVYLESPMGGIPFWSLLGLGMALLYTQSVAYKNGTLLPNCRENDVRERPGLKR